MVGTPSAETLTDLLIPPGKRLEKLSGDCAGQSSIRINQQWRICFLWSDAGPDDVEAVDVPARRINEIVHGRRRITADTALRLSRYLGTFERFWLNLQARYDLEIEKDRLGAELDDIRPLSAAS
jgi:hypothetical protein